METELLHAGRQDGRADMKLTVAFRNFANAPKTLILKKIMCVNSHNLCSFHHS